jgi:hypothetical protein
MLSKALDSSYLNGLDPAQNTSVVQFSVTGHRHPVYFDGWQTLCVPNAAL